MSEQRNNTITLLVEHAVIHSHDPKDLTILTNNICNVNGWDNITDKEIFDVCKRLSFEYLLKSFNSQHHKASNEMLAKRLDSYTKRFPQFHNEEHFSTGVK